MPSGLEVVTATRTGMGFFALLRLFIIIGVFGIIFINFFVIVVGQKDVSGGFKYLGYTFFQSTQKLQNDSLSMIQSQTTIPENVTKFRTIIDFIKNIWNLFSDIFVIYMWLWILATILLFFPIADKSKIFTAWVMSIIIFILLQMVIEKSFSVPFTAFKDLGVAVYHIFSPVTNRIINYSKNVTNLTDNINNYTNITL